MRVATGPRAFARPSTPLARAIMNGSTRHVAEDDLQRGEAVEHAGEHQAQRVQPGLDVPAEGAGAQREADSSRSPSSRRRRRPSRRHRVQVQRHPECLRALEDRPEESSSRKRSSVRPLTIAPHSPSWPTACASSTADASGSAVGSAAEPAKRSGEPRLPQRCLVERARDGIARSAAMCSSPAARSRAPGRRSLPRPSRRSDPRRCRRAVLERGRPAVHR